MTGSDPRRHRSRVATRELFGPALDRVESVIKRCVKVDRQLIRVRGEGVRFGPLTTTASYRAVPRSHVVADTLSRKPELRA